MDQQLWNRTKKVISQASNRFSEADPIVYSAAIAFFTLFSMPPILLIIVWVAGEIIGKGAIKGEVYRQVAEKVGPESAGQIQRLLERGRDLGDNLAANILTIALLVFTATVVFNFVKKALNSIWGVKPKPKKGVVKFVFDRFMSLLLIIVLGVFIVASLLADTLINSFTDILAGELLGMASYVAIILNTITSYLLVTFSFALLFKFLPDIKIHWKPVWVGAFITGLLFTLGKYVIVHIISSTNISSTYGAAGSLAAILLWVFYSSVIVLIGALITKIHFLHKGYVVTPNSNAVAVEVKEIERNHLKK
ncbi:YihY/virulence factor BrkB family protein [Nafulsella turpanensis]|uniref:YihY/virulence factor BrkB family protein n=1 Tax=Nafulsella turpanensis TaxID=1265690 RepID=UPI0003657609|nr:YihY/virulence factor BrkB family protein [Nafulsella turpanensis]